MKLCSNFQQSHTRRNLLQIFPSGRRNGALSKNSSFPKALSQTQLEEHNVIFFLSLFWLQFWSYVSVGQRALFAHLCCNNGSKCIHGFKIDIKVMLLQTAIPGIKSSVLLCV